MVDSVFVVSRFHAQKALAFTEREDAEAVARLMAFEGEDPGSLVREVGVVVGEPAPEGDDEGAAGFLRFLNELCAEGDDE